MSGVQVSVLGHAELGQTLSRADGAFDLAVNGGGNLTFNFTLDGYLPAHRQLDRPWTDFAYVPDVSLIPLDTRATAIDVGNPQTAQVAEDSRVSDADGSRQPVVLFPPGTTASMTMQDGSSRPVSSLTVRASEYTLGANGSEAMPADLPPTSSYTYAVELSAAEAVAAGASQVRFNTPLPFYVDNFLGFAVGMSVPLGSYDRASGTWLPADSGRVVQIVSITNGAADVDVTGDGAPDTGVALSDLAHRSRSV